MTTTKKPWYAVSDPDVTTLDCAACGETVVDIGPAADHHPAVCPACGIECLFFDWQQCTVQIVIAAAPKTLVRVIRWLQDDLDELEFTELLCDLEELTAGLNAKSISQRI